MNIHEAPTWNATLPEPARLARSGYVCYLRNPELHSNRAGSHPGFGRTPTDAMRAATYWANQLPWVVVVPASRAPRWALDAAEGAARC